MKRITEFNDPVAQPIFCRWPIATTSDGKHMFCGDPVSVHDGSWCDQHAKIGRENWPPSNRRKPKAPISLQSWTARA